MKKFIKVYNVSADDIDSEGNLNPKAGLYPLYMNQYMDNRTGKWFSELEPDELYEHLDDKDITYDNTSNAHPTRKVNLYNIQSPKDYERYKKSPKFSSNATITSDFEKEGKTVIGPDMSRGFSVLAYGNKDKRSGKDYFSDWHGSNSTYFDKDHIDVSPEYRRRNSTATKDVGRMSDLLKDEANTYGANEGFFKVPLIISAEDSDVVDIDDVIKNNYDPLRDFIDEVQLKRIVGRTPFPGYFKKTKVEMQILEDYITDLKYLLSRFGTYLVKYYAPPYNFQRACEFCYMTYYTARNIEDKVENLANAIQGISSLPSYDPVKTCFEPFMNAVVTAIRILFSDFSIDAESSDTLLERFHVLVADYGDDVIEKYDEGNNRNAANFKKRAVDLYREISNTIPRVKRMYSRFYKECVDYVANSKGTEMFMPDNKNISNYTSKGGAFDWYDENTYSDAGLKNIMDNCHEVTLSDAHLKFIQDDFSKYYNAKNKHNNIIKGLSDINHRM